MANLESGWHPPNAQELLEASIPDGSSWYELRLPLGPISYPIEKWDEAIGDAKAFRRVFKKAALVYCYKDGQGLHADRVL